MAKKEVPLTEEQKRLCGENVGLAYKAVELFKRQYGLGSADCDDLLAEGLHRMAVCARSFRPDLGFRFSTYVVKSMVRAMRRMAARGHRDRGRYSTNWPSLDILTPREDRRHEHSARRVRHFPETAEPDERLTRDIESLDGAMAQLSRRDREIMRLRFGIADGVKWTLAEIGMRFGLTRERVRQIEAESLYRLRRIMRGASP